MKNTSGGSYMSLGTSNNYSVGITNQSINIDPYGRVGIGTANPIDALHIKGDLSVESNNGEARCRLTTYATSCKNGFATLGCTDGKCLCFYCY